MMMNLVIVISSPSIVRSILSTNQHFESDISNGIVLECLLLKKGILAVVAPLRRGGHNRAFSHEEAYELAQYISNVYCNQHIQITLSDISLLAIEKYTALHPPHDIRDRPRPFHASPGWCYNFVKRYNIVRRRSGTHRVPTTPADTGTEARFINDCKSALTKYGAENVLNLDETFWKIVNMILYCYTKRGDTSPYIDYHGDEKEGCTAALIVSADGDILPTTVIVKGKTERSLKKLELDRFGDTNPGEIR